MLSRRTAILALLSMPLGQLNALAGGRPGGHNGSLRVNLDEWTGLIVEHKGKMVALRPSEIFAALAGIVEEGQ